METYLSRLDEYVEIRKLVSQERLHILPRKNMNNAKRLFTYSMCGVSMKYFEKAYRKKDIVFEVVHSGIRLGYPLPWQDALTHF